MKSPDEIDKENSKFWARAKRGRDKQIRQLDDLTGDARTHKLARFWEDLQLTIDPMDRIQKIAAALAREKIIRRSEILEAIIAVRGHNNPDPHPHKIAAMILNKANAWLKERGYKPAKVDAVARKIPHT